MNQHFQIILNFIQQSEHLSAEERNSLIKSLKDANKELEITSFKLDRTEKVKRTTAILLEETIEELEQKRKAVEAQNRELEVESALERVRTVAMSMKEAGDMLDVCRIISTQLELLNVKEIRNVQTAIFYKEKGTYMNYEYYAKHDKKIITETSYTNSEMHTAFAAQMLKGAGEFFTTNINGDELKDWIAHQKTTNVFIDDYLYTTLSLNYYWFSLGPVALGISTYKPLTEGETNLFKRFVKVFELAYRRYLDIEKAEAAAREAKIEAALERVRSRTLAMQKSDELSETVAVVFRQLILLGIEPNRLYISIMKDDEGEAEFWITDEDGSKVSSAYSDNLNINVSFKKMYDGWKEGRQSLVIDMHGKELQEYFAHLTSLYVPFKDGPTRKRRIQHLAYFNRGFIGMAAPDDQPEETIHLLERFAAVFNLTFTRFNDLKTSEAHASQAKEDLIKLQTEKKRAEDALTELKETQKQLVQSEKMASLGELTAGIAHEIQNPLNFVNNFSEVSKELLDEMKTALDNGDENEAKDIVNNVIQNLEKINYHGKRADAIVKGMLQHSRSGTGKKESTDVNALCDEYIRLCYHGLRAKDNSFNVAIKTDFDSMLEKINIIPQDVGRVILNVLTNAFYAVNEKKKTAGENYKPTISIQTKKLNDKIQMSVEDNGNGISQNIVDKIFQPFFTTKPTGQGTGLGLSVSYDIIKMHGGEIKVETAVQRGSKFIIQLPIL